MSKLITILLFLLLANFANSQDIDQKRDHFLFLENHASPSEAGIKSATLYDIDSFKVKSWKFNEDLQLDSRTIHELGNEQSFLYDYDLQTLKSITQKRKTNIIEIINYDSTALSKTETSTDNTGKLIYKIGYHYNDQGQLISKETKMLNRQEVDSFHYDQEGRIKTSLTYQSNRLKEKTIFYYQKKANSTFKQYFSGKKVLRTVKDITYNNLKEQFCSGDGCQFAQEDFITRKGRLSKWYQYNREDELQFSYVYNYDKAGNLIEYKKLQGEAKKEIHKRFYFYTFDNLPESMNEYLYTDEGIKESYYFYEYEFYEQ
jgi:hypothetical protein